MNQKGQALISILLIIAIATLAIASAIVSTSLSKTAGTEKESDKIFYSAESGAENALIKLLRDPVSYTDETLNLGGITVNVRVERLSPTQLEIRSDASRNNVKRTVEVFAEFEDNILTVTKWGEAP